MVYAIAEKRHCPQSARECLVSDFIAQFRSACDSSRFVLTGRLPIAGVFKSVRAEPQPTSITRRRAGWRIGRLGLRAQLEPLARDIGSRHPEGRTDSVPKPLRAFGRIQQNCFETPESALHKAQYSRYSHHNPFARMTLGGEPVQPICENDPGWGAGGDPRGVWSCRSRGSRFGTASIQNDTELDVKQARSSAMSITQMTATIA